MKIETAQAYSISKIVDNNILFTKDGSIAMLYALEQPEKFSLNEDRFDLRISDFYNAFKSLPRGTYLHKQDIYLKEDFDTSIIEGNMFLDQAMREHYTGRVGIRHYCILAFVFTDIKTLSKAYQSNPVSYKASLEKEDRENLIAFENAVQKACNIINTSYRTHIEELTENDVRTHIYRYVNGFETSGLYDIDFRDKIIGETNFDVFSFPRIEYFPNHISNIRKSEISKEDFAIYEGTMDFLGEALHANHIFNQILYFEGNKNIQNELELVKDNYGKLRSMSEALDKKYLQIEKYLTSVAEPLSDIHLVKAHYNLILFDKDKDVLAQDKNKVRALLDANVIEFHKPEREVLKDVYLGSIIGREKKLHKDNFFITHLKQALCLFTNTTIQTNDEKGVFFNDRVNQLPLRRDIWDENKKRIYARNGVIVANTGGGKSVYALNMITQYLSQNINVVVAEFGRSFQFITNLYPEISAHISYNADEPLGINPFAHSGVLTSEKLGLLKSIVLKTWRVKEFIEDSHVGVSINRLLKKYYESRDSFQSYEDFYHFVINGGTELLTQLEIDPEYFNLKSFKHNCGEFITGGLYENVFKANEETTNIIKTKQFVVFELTEIKKDPFLVTLILLILQETIDTNILADKSRKGLLLFDEFAESQSIKDLYSNDDVLSTVAVLYQKIRKENGAVYIIIQDPSQLPDNNYTKGIMANTQVLVVLASNKTTYKQIQSTFMLEDYEVDELFSLRNDFDGLHKYSEQWIKLGEYSFVSRLELSPEAYLAYQTDGEVWKTLNDMYLENNDLKKSINIYMNKTKN